eukprot:10740544-Alexandrium_andersonii.AAC.1
MSGGSARSKCITRWTPHWRSNALAHWMPGRPGVQPRGTARSLPRNNSNLSTTSSRKAATNAGAPRGTRPWSSTKDSGS